MIAITLHCFCPRAFLNPRLNHKKLTKFLLSLVVQLVVPFHVFRICAEEIFQFHFSCSQALIHSQCKLDLGFSSWCKNFRRLLIVSSADLVLTLNPLVIVSLRNTGFVNFGVTRASGGAVRAAGNAGDNRVKRKNVVTGLLSRSQLGSSVDI